MIWWILLLMALFGVVVAVQGIQAERQRRKQAERQLRRFTALHPKSDQEDREGDAPVN